MTLQQRISALITEIGLDIKALYNSPPGSFSMTTVEVNLGSKAMQSGEFSITGLLGLTVGASVMVIQAPGPYTGKGSLADEAADMCIATGICNTANSIKVFWNAVKSPLMGNIKFNYKIL